MRVFAPDYYNQFRCIADKCKNSCCIGWEIDIDDETLELYKTVSGEFGKRIMENVSCDGDATHFRLSNDERCPFLNEKNLCDIIMTLGEDSLCDICSEHPRFRNYYTDFMEIGLGLCCEAVGELVLNYKPKIGIVEVSDFDGEISITDEEQVFLNFRERLFEIIQNREKPIYERVCELLSKCNIKADKLCFSNWIDTYLSLEHLNDKWIRILSKAKKSCLQIKLDHEWDIPFEQLLIYFVYRHISDGIYDGMFRERLAFAVLSFNAVYEIFAVLIELYNIKKENRMELLIEVSRLYSAEIEYCEENTDKLFELLGEKIQED